MNNRGENGKPQVRWCEIEEDFEEIFGDYFEFELEEYTSVIDARHSVQ